MQLKKKKRSSNHTCPAFRYEIQNNVLTVALQCICMCAETSLIGNIFLKPLKIRQRYTNQHFLTFLYRPCMPYPHSVLKNKILHSGKRVLIQGINFQAYVLKPSLWFWWYSWVFGSIDFLEYLSRTSRRYGLSISKSDTSDMFWVLTRHEIWCVFTYYVTVVEKLGGDDQLHSRSLSSFIHPDSDVFIFSN